MKGPHFFIAILVLSVLCSSSAIAEFKLGFGLTSGVATMDLAPRRTFPVWGFSASAGWDVSDFFVAAETTIFMSRYLASSFTLNGANYAGDLSQRRTGIALTTKYSPSAWTFDRWRLFAIAGVGACSIDAVNFGEDIQGSGLARENKLFLRGWSYLVGAGVELGPHVILRVIYERDRYSREELVRKDNDINHVVYSGSPSIPRDENAVLFLFGLKNVFGF